MSRKALLVCMPLFLLVWGRPILAQSIPEWRTQIQSTDTKQRIYALIELNKAYNQTQLDSAVLFGQRAVIQSQALGFDSLIGVSHGQLSLSFYYQRQLDSMLWHAQMGAEAAKRAEVDLLRAYCLKMAALANSHLQAFATAKAQNEQALAIYRELEDTVRMASIYSNLGRLQQKQAIYDEALDYYIQAQNLFVELNDQEGESISAAQIGDLLLDMEQPLEAIPYHHRALELTDKSKSPIRYGDILIGLGSIYNTDEMNRDSAFAYYQAAQELFAQVNDQQGLSIVHNNLGNVLRAQKKMEQAFYHYHQARAFAVKNNWPSQIAHYAKDLGHYHKQNEQQDSAIYYYLQAYDLSLEHQFAFGEEAILKSLYEYYKETGRNKQALDIYEAYQQLREDTKNESVEKEIAALQPQFETEKKEQQIAQLELEGALLRNRTRTNYLGFTTLSLVLLLIAALLYYRRRKDRQMFELKQEVLRQEKDKLDQDVQFKTKQLTSHALHMVQKNKVLQELRMGISDLTKGADQQQKKALRSLVRRIDFNIQADEDWETFRMYFEQTNQNFYQKLTEINAELTTTDLKLCSLIKLNMNIKETAAVLNIEPTSVKTARHRLRKKLRLEPGQDLTSFIRQVA